MPVENRMASDQRELTAVERYLGAVEYYLQRELSGFDLAKHILTDPTVFSEDQSSLLCEALDAIERAEG